MQLAIIQMFSIVDKSTNVNEIQVNTLKHTFQKAIYLLCFIVTLIILRGNCLDSNHTILFYSIFGEICSKFNSLFSILL